MSSNVIGTEAKVLITGGYGFVGRRLAKRLSVEQPNWRLIIPAGPLDQEAEHRLDITDQAGVCALIEDEQPDIVVHLAAVTAIGASNRAPRDAWRVNLDGTLNIAMGLQELAPQAHLLFISSAEVYGASLNQPEPATENTLLRPLNPYAASKASADILVRQLAANGLSTSVMRPFNHTGYGQAELFVAPNFAGQIARIERGQAPPVLMVGSLDDERDFLDVDDVVNAYVLALKARKTLVPGEVFNVCSGQATRIGDLLEMLLSEARCQIEIRIDESRLRQVATTRVVGDSTHLRQTLDWAPQIPLRDTLAGIMAEKRALIA